MRTLTLLAVLWFGCDDGAGRDPAAVDQGRPDAAQDAAAGGGGAGGARDGAPPEDAAPADARVPDQGPAPDAAPRDGAVAADAAAPLDAAGLDAAPADAAPVDAAPVDAAPVDAAPVDAAVPDAAPEPDRSDEAFDPLHLLQVDITMDPAEWDRMRLQGRSFATVFQPGCLDQPFASPFDWFTADVTIDGEAFPGVGIRKKGFLGSLSDTRPSVKIDFDRNGGALTFRSLTRMTFNNNRQDNSQLRQCIAYRAFAAAGVRVPRCSFAHVRVNGTSLGVYTHIESMKKPFLRRHFADADGDFYEGQFSDFRAGWDLTFQKETNEAAPGQPAVVNLSTAAAVPDDQLFEALGARLDLPGFYRFWAMEAVTGHWDGYSGNTNNYYIYDDPTSGKVVFMPWGTDGTFSQNPFGGGALASVQAVGVLSRRLYVHPQGGGIYLNALRDALATFDEADLLATLDQWAPLVEPALHAEQRGGFAQTLGALRQYIQNQRGRIEREIAAGPPRVGGNLRAPFCQPQIGDFDFQFDTTWGTYPGANAFAGGGMFAGTLNGQPIAVQRVGSTAGTEAAGRDAGQVIILGTLQQANGALQVRVRIEPVVFQAGELPVNDNEVSVTLIRPGGFGGGTVGLAYRGTLTLDAAGRDAGAAVRGRVVGLLMQPR